MRFAKFKVFFLTFWLELQPNQQPETPFNFGTGSMHSEKAGTDRFRLRNAGLDLLFVTSVLDMKNPNCVYVFKGTVVMRFSTNFLFGQKNLPGPHICKHAKTVSLNLSRTSNFAIEYLWVNEIFFK